VSMMLKLAVLSLLVTLISTQQVVEDVLCEGRVFEPKCGQGNIRIIAASFGVTDSGFCGGTDNNQWAANCAVDVAEQIRGLCAGRPTCSIPVEGRNPCAGNVKYLQVVWGCESGIPQNRVNNRGVNILVSSNPTRTNAIPLHGQTVRGSSLYVFLSSNDQIMEARWFVDQNDLVVTTATQAPFELQPGRAWDTTTLTDGVHRVMVLIAFSDQAIGTIDATITIRNGVPVAAAALSKPSDSFVESGTVTEVQPTVPSAVPWALFAFAAVTAVILIIVVIYKVRATPAARP